MSERNSGATPDKAVCILVATVLGSSMAFIDGTVVNVALPFLQADLDASATGVQWVVQAYSLFLAALILVGGSLGDRLGRRRMYLAGVIVFTIASVIAGLSPNLEMLIAARTLQGVGGALLIPGGLAIISALWTGDARGKAIGTWAGFSSITSAIGPVLGGFLVEQFSWRAVFLINVPIAAVVVVVAIWAIPETRDDETRGLIDWLGAALITLALGGAVLGFTAAAANGWTAAITVLALGVSVVAGVMFVMVERHITNPMVDLSLFRSSTFTGANLLTLFLYAGLGATLFYLPFNLVQVHGYSATGASAAILPFALIMFAGSRWAGGLIGRFGARLPLIAGPVIVGVAFLLFAIPGDTGSYWTTFFPCVVVLAIGMVVTVAPLTTTVMNAVDDRHSGLASGVNNAVSRAGGVLAIAVFSIVMLGTFTASLETDLDGLPLSEAVRGEIASDADQLAVLSAPSAVDEDERGEFRRIVDNAFVDGFRAVIVGGAIIAFLSAGMAAMLIKDRDVVDCGTGGPVPSQQPG